MSIKAIIIDDERLARNELKKIIGIASRNTSDRRSEWCR